ncbi:tetratricopeptide repeat protein [Algihabitans albus]|uniref:tetratricopeptide repeat protein n=1 Tax=Algihabitans albus TaxID=2164067 RepID=UPI000E5D7AF1|nr:tetratricopeptide repeat protein [Algihabitans albus]
MQSAQPEPAIAEILGYLSRGYPRTAADRATALLADQPDHAEAQRLYGVALYRLEESDEAISALRRAVELAPNSPPASWGLAEALQTAGQAEEAGRILLRLVEVGGEEPVALLLLARLSMAAKRTDEAYDYARRALAVDPEVEGGRRILAALAYRHGALSETAELMLPGRRRGGEADPACFLARSLYGLGRSRLLAELPAAETPAQRHNEAVLRALAAWRENRVDAVLRDLDLAEAEKGSLEGESLVAVFATVADLLRRLLTYRADRPDLYEGEVAALIVAIGDTHCISAGHLVVPWQGGQALLLPEPLLEATPSALVADSPEPLQTAFRLALDRMPKGAIPAICIGELDLRLTQGLFSQCLKMSDSALMARIREVASDLAAFVAAEGQARGLTPILMTPPASNAPLTLVPAAQRSRFLIAHKCFVASLTDAAERLGLPLLDLRAVTLSGEQVRQRRYIDTNHLWPETFVEAFARHPVLPEQSPS